MNSAFKILNHDWHAFLQVISQSHSVYVPVKTKDYIDYKLFEDISQPISYNVAKPVTPLKNFFLPVKDNVVIEKGSYKKNVIIGIPACDLKALELLDKIYLDPSFIDNNYKARRENAILIGTDCFETAENCHCTSYNVDPFPTAYADASLASGGDYVIITVHSPKGERFFSILSRSYPVHQLKEEDLQVVNAKREKIRKELVEKNNSLPDYVNTGRLIRDSGDEIWVKHAQPCVSCGACTTACPTCTCFLLIDRPDFEKVKQVDACQYPGFERIAAGEDPLRRKFIRFRNRYLCKYVWKPESFGVSACTGCGRCIDSCIGNINKNKIFIEMAESI
jgi:sulfhydrogenase subunit beta (sulfur reductase)